jgi:myo-inositol-1(or 4)-monophosphatase
MVSDFTPSPMTQVAIEAALKAGTILRAGYGTQYKISVKPGVQNYVTEYDYASERCLIEHIKQRYANHSFLCEESGSTLIQNSDVLWIIDPLDGTTNFTHDIPIFCISIGAYAKDHMVCGVIYQPITEELFVAEKGRGAYLNGKRLHVSSTANFVGSLGATGFPHNVDKNPIQCIDSFISILKEGTIIRNLGSSAINLAYVAAGRFDSYWAVSLHTWDVAAGKLLIEEAGGTMTTYTGEPYHVLSNAPLAASNSLIHRELLQYLKGNYEIQN